MMRIGTACAFLALMAGCMSGPESGGGGPQPHYGRSSGPPTIPGVQGPYGQPVAMNAPYSFSPPPNAHMALRMMNNSVPMTSVQMHGGSCGPLGCNHAMTPPGGAMPPTLMPRTMLSPPGLPPAPGMPPVNPFVPAGGPMALAGGIQPPNMPMPGGVINANIPPGGMPPGGVVQAQHVQPGATPAAAGIRFQAQRTQVRFVEPSGMRVQWFAQGADGKPIYSTVPIEAPGRYNFPQAAVYRLKLTNIKGRPGLEIYPTMEVVPSNFKTEAFLAHSAVPVKFTEEDLQQIAEGNYLTKVIYLPDPQFQDVAGTGTDEILSTRLEPGADPIREAANRGSILLVLRMGNVDQEAPNSPPLNAPSGAGATPHAAPAPTFNHGQYPMQMPYFRPGMPHGAMPQATMPNGATPNGVMPNAPAQNGANPPASAPPASAPPGQMPLLGPQNPLPGVPGANRPPAAPNGDLFSPQGAPGVPGAVNPGRAPVPGTITSNPKPAPGTATGAKPSGAGAGSSTNPPATSALPKPLPSASEFPAATRSTDPFQSDPAPWSTSTVGDVPGKTPAFPPSAFTRQPGSGSAAPPMSTGPAVDPAPSAPPPLPEDSATPMSPTSPSGPLLDPARSEPPPLPEDSAPLPEDTPPPLPGASAAPALPAAPAAAAPEVKKQPDVTKPQEGPSLVPAFPSTPGTVKPSSNSEGKVKKAPRPLAQRPLIRDWREMWGHNYETKSLSPGQSLVQQVSFRPEEPAGDAGTAPVQATPSAPATTRPTAPATPSGPPRTFAQPLESTPLPPGPMDTPNRTAPTGR